MVKAYDIYKITSPEYEDRWSLVGQVVVSETYADERAARDRAKKLNDARDEYDKAFLTSEVRDRERRTTYLVCKFPSIYDEDKFTGTDAVCHEHGYESREEAERRVRELNDDRNPFELDGGVLYALFERTV